VTIVSQSSGLGEAVERIPIRNAWYLLLYAWDMAAWRGRWRGACEESPSLLGLLARILSETTRDLLKRQLGRAYAIRNQTLRGIRGRIDFAGSLRRLSFECGAAHCRFSELSVDTLKNRILLATLCRLASDPRLTHPNPQEESKLRHDLHSLTRAMEGVSVIPISPTDFGRLQLSRNDQEYLLPMTICALIHRLAMPTEEEGDQALAWLLGDEIRFHQLFERFVRNFYRFHLDNHEVRSEGLDWHDELACNLVPSMRTDITITVKTPPYRRLIIDTKYSKMALAATPHGGLKFKSPNLYQMYTYLRTQEHLSEAHRTAQGMLIYPTTNLDLDEAMSVQGHLIRVVTVDLARPWDSIEARLLALVTSTI
jgi:5-methylcytosine-specific restriction enzyme subunit McrC